MCISLVFVMSIKHLINLLWRKEITLLGNLLTWRERETQAILSIYTSLLVLWLISTGSTRGDMRVNAYGTCLGRYLNEHRCALTATCNINSFQAEIPVVANLSIANITMYLERHPPTTKKKVIFGIDYIRHSALVIMYNRISDKEWRRFTNCNESGN